MASRMLDASPDAAQVGKYVVTAQRPTAIRSSCVGHFTSPEHINLIISKVTRLEIHRLTDDGLLGMLDAPIYGRIASMQLFRPQGSDKDLLFFFTEKMKFCILEYDLEADMLVSRAIGDASSRVGRPNENGIMAVIDPTSRVIAIQAYDTLLKFVHLKSNGEVGESWDTRIDELSVLDMKFLHGYAQPTLAIIHEEASGDKHLKTYTIPTHETDIPALSVGDLNHSNIDRAANLLIPMPAPLKGVLIIGEKAIIYKTATDTLHVPLSEKLIKAYGAVDPDGSRWLLGDIFGILHLLVLQHDGTRVLGLKLQILGNTTAPSTISYLDSGVVFIGSIWGDSQLIKLHSEPVDPASPQNFVEVKDTYTNLGPIVDFCAMDLGRQGQMQIVTCSGVRRDGSLRVVNSGIGMVGQVSAELDGIRGIWSLRAAYDDEYDKLLVLTFVGETRVLGMDEEDELGEMDVEGFDDNAQTLYCGNVIGDQIVQVTANRVLLLSSAQQFVADWRPPAGSEINVASGNASQVMLVSGRGNVVLLEVSGKHLVEAGVAKFDTDIACLDITPLDASEPAKIAVMGMWDQTVLLVSLPDLKTVFTEKIGGDIIPRNVLLTVLDGICFLLVALGDGRLINYHINPQSSALSERKSIALGTKPINLRPFISKGAKYIFAASDRPTIIYSNNRKLLYSNLNEDEVNFMTPFNTAGFPDSIAIAKSEELTIGRIDEVQKLHVRTIPIGEQPRKICHCPSERSVIVVASAAHYATGMDPDADTLKLLDEQNFEILDSYALEETEVGCSISTVQFTDDDKTYIAVGTAHVIPEEADSKTGRVLVFEIVDRRLKLAAFKEVKGPVYCIQGFQGMLLCARHGELQLYQWTMAVNGSRELTLLTTHNRGQLLTLFMRTHGNYVIIGDIMRSVSLIVFKPEENSFETRARDHNPAWMLAIEMFNEEDYLGAENSYNLFSLRKSGDVLSDDERCRLQSLGYYHLGEQVNQLRKGSLVMKTTDNPALANLQTVLFGTISGAMGIIASLPTATYDLLADLEASMKGVIQGVGGLKHTDWRAFTSELTFKQYPAQNFIDGDLVEQFLELREEGMQKAIGGMKRKTTVEEISRLIEELGRALH